jgi:hypothetical protein
MPELPETAHESLLTGENGLMRGVMPCDGIVRRDE